MGLMIPRSGVRISLFAIFAIIRFVCALMAQLVERLISNEKVLSSNLSEGRGSNLIIAKVAQW